MDSISIVRAKNMSVSTLAFVGDAVFTLYVRERLSLNSDYKSGVLTKRAAIMVSATSQSKMLETVSPLLNEDEMAIVKTGRNAQTHTKAKNASLSDYKRATALETLFGYLYLTGQEKRLIELEDICFVEGEK